jgi:hypothetical protein
VTRSAAAVRSRTGLASSFASHINSQEEIRPAFNTEHFTELLHASHYYYYYYYYYYILLLLLA